MGSLSGVHVVFSNRDLTDISVGQPKEIKITYDIWGICLISKSKENIPMLGIRDIKWFWLLEGALSSQIIKFHLNYVFIYTYTVVIFCL